MPYPLSYLTPIFKYVCQYFTINFDLELLLVLYFFVIVYLYQETLETFDLVMVLEGVVDSEILLAQMPQISQAILTFIPVNFCMEPFTYHNA